MNLYMEGGPHLRVPMNGFIKRAVGRNLNLKVIPCGSRAKTIDRFAKAAGALPSSILMIDSEGEGLNALAGRLSTETSLPNSRFFFMVELMEAWFLADRQTLGNYFGRGFRPNRLPGNPSVEMIPKQDVLNGLNNATRDSGKGPYKKGTHDGWLLSRLDPSTVYRSCPNFRRLIDHLRR